ncbi:hypothetical protein SCLCIDRAFT_134529 [Scleroderma citrinum Foug A]|uniref:Anaphase-promoting complex subunit 4 WD40 domain-containing protein n=1 Tax=Scleroderma citrinum Foug A TaxID=1036808 RepID=A0A0C3DHJ5_9AGAM|nr:hypothetical protein SCLCIDRAFT_134529 [Scleroderma citrinum Foug A]
MFTPTPTHSKYKLDCRLVGHQDAILCLAVSSSGELLASGGIDGLRIWNLEKKKLPGWSQLWNPGDPVTSVTWVMREDNVQEGLCCGTGLGYLIILRQHPNRCYNFEEIVSKRIGTGTEIMAISADTSNISIRLTTGTRDQRVQVWSLDSKYHLFNVFSVELMTVPQAMFFWGADVIVFGMHDGAICILRGKDDIVLGTKQTGMVIGAAAMDPNLNFFVIDNATIGFSLHRMEDATCIKTYNTKPLKLYPKQVTFAEKGRVIVGGSDTGIVHILDKTSGDVLQLLQHSKSGQVQTITTHEAPDHHLIAAASSSNDNTNIIMLWKKLIKAQNSGNPTWGTIQTVLQVTMQLLVIATVGVFLYCTMVSALALMYPC